MFERYTEKGRRVIFFARYHASRFGSPYIETEHLLLGLMSEDADLRERLRASRGTAESLSKEIESRIVSRQTISTSVDLPLSQDSKRALAYAAEESEALQHTTIDCGHVTLGLMRIENCLAATFLKQHGVEYAAYRDTLRRLPPARPVRMDHGPASPMPEARPVERAEEWDTVDEVPAAPALAAPIVALKQQVVAAVQHLDIFSEEYGEQRLKRKPWSRKEALGHLINLATAHHQWIARALTEPGITTAGYPSEEWVSVQRYQQYSWRSLVDLWVAMNQLLVHVLASVPEEKLNLACRIGIEQPKSLLAVVLRYVEQTEDIAGQILSIGH